MVLPRHCHAQPRGAAKGSGLICEESSQTLLAFLLARPAVFGRAEFAVGKWLRESGRELNTPLGNGRVGPSGMVSVTIHLGPPTGHFTRPAVSAGQENCKVASGSRSRQTSGHFSPASDPNSGESGYFAILLLVPGPSAPLLSAGHGASHQIEQRVGDFGLRQRLVLG